jgi:iron complex outermembrane recepter protein
MSVERFSVRLMLLVAIAGGAILNMALPGRAQQKSDTFLIMSSPLKNSTHNPQLKTQNSPISRIHNLQQPATTVKDWVAQIEAATVQVTGVSLNPTEFGLEIVLETAEGKLLQIDANQFRTEGNTLIADIPNAMLALPDAEEFNVDNPTEEIANVRVTQLNASSIQVSVTGNNALPTEEVILRTGDLAYSLNPEAELPDEEIVVTGERQGEYYTPNVTTATKTDTSLRDIPQSIQVVPQQVLRDQRVDTLLEALKNVPGATQAQGSSRSPFVTPTIRGFDASNSILRDGVPEVTGFVTNYDPISIDQVEVLKGPASVLYGQGSLGGTINLITKQPLSEAYYALEASAGRFDFYSGAFDFSGPLNENRTVLYRLNAAAQTSESFIDFYDRQRYFIRPVLAWQIGANTRLTLDTEYFNIQQPLETGVPLRGSVLNNIFGEIPRDRYVGEPSDEGDYQVFRIGYNLEHQFSDNWRINSTLRSSFFQYDRESVFGIGLINDRTLRRLYQNNDSEENIYYLDTYAVGKFSTGNIQHQLLTGFNLSRRDSNLANFNRAAAPLDLFDPVYGQPLGAVTSRLETADLTDALGIYVQDQVTIAANLKLLLGVRFDTFNQTTEDQLADTEQEQSDDAFSPRVGIVYQPMPAISLYASYSRSFNPSIGTAFDGSQFQPERGTQYEVGTKIDLNNRLSATLAFYDLTRSNVITTDPINPDFSIQTGKQQSQGIELDISGEILPGWNIIAGYAYTDAQIEEDNDFPVGNALSNVPKHSFNLWTTYEIQTGAMRGLGFGLGVFYVGDRQGDLANTFELPNYLRTDAAVFYRRNRFRVALNFRNLFDIEYFEAAQNRNRVFYGEPFTVQGTISWQF